MRSRHRGSIPVLVLLFAGLTRPAGMVTGDRLAPAGGARGGLEAAPRVGSSPVPELSGWHADRALVRLAPGASLEELARDHGAPVLRGIGPSGLATLGLPAGEDLGALLGALAADPRVARVGPSGRVRGASGPGAFQWHLPVVGAAELTLDAAGVTVAVLDTGVAHAEGCEAVPGLAAVEVVAPLDLVNGTAAACDDHQHGTHIASLIASRGALRGLGQGAALMPVKVLDAENEGDEQALVDGILWAVEQGADIVNLSLSFEADYTPSPELLAALRLATEADVLLVAAAGNGGTERVRWPAASPLVIAVGASALSTGGALAPAPYGDLGPEIDLLAPGGSLDVDQTGDGRGDGVLAETIGLRAPEQSGYWFYEGTSQAAALVSGAAARLLAAGVAPEDVLPALQASARALYADGYERGLGAGSLDLGAALAMVEAGEAPAGRALHASVLPYLLRGRSGLTLVPSARVFVTGEDGEPLAGVRALGRADGATGARRWSCDTDAAGHCLVALPAVEAADADGEQVRAAWRFTVDAVVLDDGSAASPTPMIVATDALEALSLGLAEAGVSEATLAWSWDGSDDRALGPLAEALTLVEPGRAGAIAPSALLLTERLAASVLEFDGEALALGGAGVSTDALGISAQRSSGTGVSTDALGVGEERSVARVSGAGVSTDALGVTALSIHGRREGEGDAEGASAAQSWPVFPGEPSAEEDLSGTAVQEAFNLAGEPQSGSVVQALGVLDALGLLPEGEEAGAAEAEAL